MKTKIELLIKTKEKLKKDFVGLDSIIDNLIEMITPWYVTPELLERPVVISLFGLTGTGKTSLIKKLLEYLDLSNKALFFDSGEQVGGGGLDDSSSIFSEKLNNFFDGETIISEENRKKYGIEDRSDSNNIFVFDEFQHIRTLDGTGEFIDRPESRAIWNLIDSGIINISVKDYVQRNLNDYLLDIEDFSKSNPGVLIKDGSFDPKFTNIIKKKVNYFKWVDTIEDLLPVIEANDRTTFIRRLEKIKKGFGVKLFEKLDNITRLSDFIDEIKPYINLLSDSKIIDCKKSLIFIIGNLDDAFKLSSSDMDPDIDADIFHKITSKVNIMDIKLSLKSLFRDEQVGRLGNNILIYPSLGRKDFKIIIEKELCKISERFKLLSGINLEYSESFKDLLYSEGVFPVQGTRPVFTTISSIVSPRLSDIIINKGDCDRAILNIHGETNFEQDTIEVYSELYKGEEHISDTPIKTINLVLGSIRNPKKCKKLALQSVHEACHSVLYSKLTGELPSVIIASSIMGGGFMMEKIKENKDTMTKNELETDIIVSLAGYFGERYFFNSEYCSLGSGSDIDNVWKVLSESYYNNGLYLPIKFTDSSSCEQNFGNPWGFPIKEESGVNKSLKRFFESMCDKTKKLIKEEETLILEVSKYLSKNRCMSSELFKEYIDSYGSCIIIKDPDYNYYKERIENLLYKE